jgi:hypothetical protein
VIIKINFKTVNYSSPVSAKFLLPSFKATFFRRLFVLVEGMC